MNSVETSFSTITAPELKDAVAQALHSRFVVSRRGTYKNVVYRGYRIYNLFNVSVKESMAMAIVVDFYPNKRVLWLANHHPKERVRKKNYRRIFKWAERQGIL